MAYLFGHKLWVAQRADGNWQVWIEGKKPLQNETTVFKDQDEAKNMAHSLAHWHLEEKRLCGCTAELLWEVPGKEERRAAGRIEQPCEIWSGDGKINIGRMVNLSTGGAFIQTLDPPSEGSVLALIFDVGGTRIKIQGKVVHRTPNQGMGVRFLGLDLASCSVIANWAIVRSRSHLR
jgi:hypothetical protein